MKLYEVTPQLYFGGTMLKTSRLARIQTIQKYQLARVLNLWPRGYDRELQGLINSMGGTAFDYLDSPFEEGGRAVPVELLQNRAAMALTFSAGKNTLVQCYGGKNRSATVCGLVAMLREHISGEEAYQRIKAARPAALDNLAYANWLRSLP